MSCQYLKYAKHIIAFAVFLGLSIACTTTHHREKVDKNVYAILRQAEQDVFKKQSKFSIKTSSSEKPQSSINNTSLLKRTNQSGIRKLNLSQSLSYAIKNSREYQSEKEKLYLTALSMSDAKIPFSINAISKFNSGVERTGSGSELLDASSTNSLSTILKGGGSLSLSLANDLLRYFTGGTDRPVSSVITFNLMQPLLRGRGADIAAENLTQSYRNVIYQLRSYEAFQQNFSREIVIDYLRLLQRQEQVKNELQNFRSRQENYEYLEARSIDRASPEEVADAQQGALEAETRYIDAETNYSSALDTFKLRLGMPAGITLELDQNELNDIITQGLTPLQLSQKVAYQKALKNRASLLNEIDRFEDSRRDVLISANNLKTNLDFVSTTSISNSGSRWERLNFNDVSANVGLELDLPVNRKRERNNYRRSLIRFDSQTRSLSQTHDELRNLIKLRYREIEQFRKNYEIQLGAVKLAKRRVEGNRLRLKAGTLIFRRLSESQDSLIRAQNAVTSALVSYQESRLRLYEELGILDISAPNFWLK